MMLTSIPSTLLHRVRSSAAYVHDLAQLGLDLLCPCDEGHGARLHALGGEDVNGCPDGEHLAVDCPGDACRTVASIPAERLAGLVRLDRQPAPPMPYDPSTLARAVGGAQ